METRRANNVQFAERVNLAIKWRNTYENPSRENFIAWAMGTWRIKADQAVKYWTKSSKALTELANEDRQEAVALHILARKAELQRIDKELARLSNYKNTANPYIDFSDSEKTIIKPNPDYISNSEKIRLTKELVALKAQLLDSLAKVQGVNNQRVELTGKNGKDLPVGDTIIHNHIPTEIAEHLGLLDNLSEEMKEIRNTMRERNEQDGLL